MMDNSGPRDTQSKGYTQRLQAYEGKLWKRLLDVQRPYRYNLRRLKLGHVLDLGCGIGRSLANVNGQGVGIDHNPDSVRVARERGLTAFSPAEFTASPCATEAGFDSLLLSHVVEHQRFDANLELIRAYLKYLKPQGRLVIITPQERGYASDASHVEFVDFACARRIAETLGFHVQKQYSFPFPRVVGKVFAHNEFISVFGL